MDGQLKFGRKYQGDLDFSLTFFCIPRLLCLCRVETLESLPAHSFNGFIISSARVCTLQSSFVFLFLMILIYVSSSYWGLGRAAVCDCGTPWTFLLPFFLHNHACCVCAVWRPFLLPFVFSYLLLIKRSQYWVDPKSKMVLVAAILKNFFSGTRRSIDSILGRTCQGDL